MRKILAFASLLLFASPLWAQNGLIKGEFDYYLPNTVIVKLKTVPNADGRGNVSLPANLAKAAALININSAVQPFPAPQGALLKGEAPISKIVSIDYSSGEDPVSVSNRLAKNPDVEWAEPRYARKVNFDVNDTHYNSLTQYNLFKIKAAEAWDINKGNKNILIGIIDSGVYWGHPDLQGNIYQNLAEDADRDGHTIEWNGTNWILDPGDLNGIDDDGNGFKDDLAGWDFGGSSGTPDNNPEEDPATHGTLVAGVASAVTNNNLGVASIGFNCSILPVKCTRKDMDSRYIIYAIEGIKYAADKGAKIINCSFAGYSYSKAEQEVIDYAVSKGALVIAAAGNDNLRMTSYPSGYNGVLSAAASNATDARWGASNYGESIDVTAPGQLIYSTWGSDGYTSANGTSFAAPLTAGLAGLLINQFPSYTPLQIGELIRVTADDISSANADSLRYLLGKGRINAYKALTAVNPVSVRGTKVEFIDESNRNGVIEKGETASIKIKFINYLSPVSGVQATISCSSPYISIQNSSFTLPALATLDSAWNSSSRFSFRVNSAAPNNLKVNFLITYTGNGYNDFQWISVMVNPTFGTMADNNISLSITGTGNIGFSDYPANTEGTGLRFLNGENILFEGSFLYGTSPSMLADAARIDDSEQSRDFKAVSPFIKISAPAHSDSEGSAVFNDDNAGSNKLGIETKLIAYTYKSAPYNNFIILRGVLRNKSAANITGLYCGWYLDLDLDESDYQDDIAVYDQQNKLVYAYDSNNNPIYYYTGASLLTNQNFKAFTVDNAGSNNGISINPSFTKNSKWSMLSGAVSKTSAGPGDISLMFSAGPVNINAGSYANVAFVIAFGENLNSLRNAIALAGEKYALIPDDDGTDPVIIPDSFALSQNYPNPFASYTRVQYDLPKEDYVSIKVFDILGREVALLKEGTMPAGKHFALFSAGTLPSGTYILRIETPSFSAVKKMMLMK